MWPQPRGAHPLSLGTGTHTKYPQTGTLCPKPHRRFSRRNGLQAALFSFFRQVFQSFTKNRDLQTITWKAFIHVPFRGAGGTPGAHGPLWETLARLGQAPRGPQVSVAPLSPQDQKIYIYSLKGMCPLNTPQRALDTPAVVTCFLAVPVLKRVR